MFKLDYWLYVSLSNKVEGYIYAPNARPAINADFQASAPTSIAIATRKNKRMVTRDGVTARPLYFFLKRWGNLCFFVVSLGVLIGGVNLLGLGMTNCAAMYAGTECVSSLETWSAVLIFVGSLMVVCAVYRLVAQLARRFSRGRA
jgi:hypothetical protein